MKAHRRPVSAAGGGQLSCNSRTGQIKNPPSECSGSNHIRHSYRMGLATTTTAASGRCREELLGQRPARRKCRPRHARMLGAATRGTKKEPTGLFFAACGRPCSFDSSYGLHETATTLDIPSRWDPRTKQQPTGLIAYPAAQGRAVQVLLSAVECFQKDYCKRKETAFLESCRHSGSPPGRRSYRPRNRGLTKAPLGLWLRHKCRRPVQVLLSALHGSPLVRHS